MTRLRSEATNRKLFYDRHTLVIEAATTHPIAREDLAVVVRDAGELSLLPKQIARQIADILAPPKNQKGKKPRRWSADEVWSVDFAGELYRDAYLVAKGRSDLIFPRDTETIAYIEEELAELRKNSPKGNRAPAQLARELAVRELSIHGHKLTAERLKKLHKVASRRRTSGSV